MNKSIINQKKRYDAEATQHSEHYNDKYTQMYRDEFIRAPLFKENLQGMYILDAMCASGIETGFLIKKGAKVVGLDISQKNVDEYNRIWGKPCFVNSIHKTNFSNNTFDAIYICGGLHHVLPLLNETILEIHRILKPNGLFYFMEPNKDTWVNKLRKFWYKRDDRFADDEEAISYENTLKPFLSNAVLIFPILPSIISEGAMISHFISACSKDCFINISIVKSLSILLSFIIPS